MMRSAPQNKSMRRHSLHLSLLLIALSSLLLTTSCSKADVRDVFEQYLWQNRVVLVFAPEREDPSFQAQMRDLRAHIEGLEERDIVRWAIVSHDFVMLEGDLLPYMGTPPLYDHFNVDESAFAFILLGKDGEEKQRSETPVNMKELFALVDQMPMRQREIRQGH